MDDAKVGARDFGKYLVERRVYGGGAGLVIMDNGWWDADGVNRLVMVQAGCMVIGKQV